ncbi:NDP-sugar dehydratase or epimerase [Rubrobacter xylanophilus]|uniref:NDP-sugar dehydratase or epimerase n=1 Tax=Rubrobacter xylanophilus TaxID=49319 RepID=A0A510HJ61_9ACTN|nr:NDP-sugar dehydratase or epimerase [Rubrobacter xylanophilus]
MRSLVGEGHAVRVVDDLSVGTREDLGAVCGFREVAPERAGPMQGEGVELVVGDILDEGLARRVCSGAEVVVHLAASTGVAPSVEDPRRDCATNVIGTLNYLEAARGAGVRRFVFASSGAAAGEVDPPIHEEVCPRPVSPYGAGKLAGEAYCSAYHRTFGLETVALRFGNVYGPGSGHKNSVVAKFIRRASRGEPLEIYGDGTQTRDFIYIGDLVRALRLAATARGAGGEVFQIATGHETSVGELVELLLPALAAAGIKDVRVRRAAPRPGDVLRNYADTSKARRLLGWRAEVGLEEGLRRTVEWFVERGEL